MDEYAGSRLRLGRGVDDPFEDHHKHQVAKETQHEDQLRNEHEKYAAHLAKVATKKKQHEKERHEYTFNYYGLFKRYSHTFGEVLQTALRIRSHAVRMCCYTVTYM